MHILFVTATRIGDAVLSTGLLSHVIERFPGARLTIAAGPVAAPLFEAVPGLAEVLAAAHERAQAAPLLAAPAPGGVIDLVGRTDLLTAAAVLRRCSLFIGNDTGLTHIAAAAGIPTLALFGPSPVEQYAPWGAF